VTAPEPTHSTPRPRPNPSSTRARPPCPVLLDAHRQGPRTGELLDALAPDALAYKSPRRSNDWTPTIPSYLPDTFSPSLSLSFDDTYTAGAVLDASCAAALDRRWTSGGWEPEEERRRNLFHPSPSSSASPTRLAITVVFLAVRRWASTLADEHDAPESLD
jgi:hypothetical protein